MKYIFFDFNQDSTRSRAAQICVPMQGQTGSISNSLVVDYIKSTRISINTSIIAAKKDTLLALHSLFNGIGNFSGEWETPISCHPIFYPHNDFIGFSFNPRFSTVINTSNVFEKSTLCSDIGFNTVLKLSGDLGNISIKIIFRSAFAVGNYQFLEKIYGIKTFGFYYNSLQLKLKATPNVFIINIPLILMPINGKEISNFPVYASFGFNF
jgi:hypothetical protein